MALDFLYVLLDILDTYCIHSKDYYYLRESLPML